MNKSAILSLSLSALLSCAGLAAAKTETVYIMDEKYIVTIPEKTAADIPSVYLRKLAPGGDSSVPTDSNVPEAVKTQLAQDLQFISSIQGSGATKLHQQIYGMVQGSNYYNFFVSRVKSIGLDSHMTGNAVAYVSPMMDSSKMWLTNNYIKFSHPQIARLMVVFHEARHTEDGNGNWHHATCPTPFELDGKEVLSIWTGSTLAGEPACDSTPFGSYGSSTIMLRNIQKYCTNCTGKVKEDAGLYSQDQLKRVTNPKATAQMMEDLYKD